MPPKKKTKVASDNADNGEAAVAVHQMEDIVANVLAWLCVEEIMGKRRVCKKWKEAVRKTIVPPTEFRVDRIKKYNAMNVMTRAMPNLQQIAICEFIYCERKYNDGEDPNEERAARTADWTTHDIGIISNFSKLRILEIGSNAQLNGRYPFLFNSFPLLQKFSVKRSDLKWDLDMLAGFPLLKELYCHNNHRLSGNISSLRVLKDTLEKVSLYSCVNIEGDFMDLADFPHLKELRLGQTAVTGDIRDINDNDFSSLEELALPKEVYGGNGYECQRISDGLELIRAVCLLKKQRPALIMKKWYGKLSEDSPDWYNDAVDFEYYFPPPFYIHFVKAGSRFGYRWRAYHRGEPCEVNWLDPEPDKGSSGYEKYIEDLGKIDGVDFYRGFHQPPTEEEYHRLVEDYETDSESYGEYSESESDE